MNQEGRTLQGVAFVNGDYTHELPDCPDHEMVLMMLVPEKSISQLTQDRRGTRCICT